MGLSITLGRTRIIVSERAALAGLLAVGLLLRAWQLQGAFWYDEAFSARLAVLPFENVIEATFYDVHPATFYLVLWSLVRLFGSAAEPVLRLPSLLAGLGLIVLVYRLGRTLGLPAAAVWLATVIMTFAPFQIYYSDEARFYALQTACLAVAALGLVQRRYPWLIMGSVAALYLHNASAVYVAGLFGAAWLCRPNLCRSNFKFDLRAALIIAACFIPGLVWSTLQAVAITNNYWIPPLSSPGRVLATLDDLLFLVPSSPYMIPSALTSSVGWLLIARHGRKIWSSPETRWLLLLVILPLGLLVAASVLWQPVLISRIAAPLAPFYYLLLAWAVTQTARQWSLWTVCAAPTTAIILAGLLAGQLGHRPVDADYLSLFGHYRPGDAIYHANPGSYLTFLYYRPDIPQYVWPQRQAGLAQMLDWRTRLAMGLGEEDFSFIQCARFVGWGGAESGRWWLIESNGPATTPAERSYVQAILAANQVKNKIKISQGPMANAWLYLLEPDCPKTNLAERR